MTLMIRVTNLKDYYTPISVSGNIVKIAFDYKPFYDIDEDGNKVESNVGTWAEHVFRNKPSLSQVKDFILTEINKRTDRLILSGFVWKGVPVWLSMENQLNYKTAYDLAVQTNGQVLPTFKFGTTESPVYYKFESLEDLKDFYISAMSYVTDTLAAGWQEKDKIDWTVYEDLLK
nr:MAG TPA: protein of unknown function (DUF4376) [Crassvirales sp.]